MIIINFVKSMTHDTTLTQPDSDIQSDRIKNEMYKISYNVISLAS